MKYVTFNSRCEMLPSRQPLLVTPPVQRAGAPSSGTLADLQAFWAAIDCQYVKPTFFLVDEEMGDRSDGVLLHLLHVGFSLALPDRCQLKWMRFIVESSAATLGDRAAIQFVSLLPEAVSRENDFAGPIEIDDDGSLTRKLVAF